MDDEHHQNTYRANTPPGPSKESAFALSRVTSAPEPNHGHSYWHSPFDRFRSATSWHSIQDTSAATPRWAAAPSKTLDTLVEERPEKRIRLDQPGTTSVATVKYGAQPAMRYEDRQHEEDWSSPSTKPVPCENCRDSEKDLASIVQDLLKLQTLAGSPPSESTSASSTLSKTAADVTKRGLRYALGWAAMEMRNARKAAQGASSAATATTTTTHRSMPSLPGIVSTVSAYPPSTRRLSMPSATPRQGHMPPLADQSRLDSHQRHLSPFKSGRLHSSYESLPPILVAPDEMKRGSHYEHSGRGSAQSPQTSSGGSVYGTGQSPMQSLSVGRSLPSPPGTHFSHAGIPPSSHSHVSASQAAHTSHLQDLQHQISTKALALQTLQREHDALLAAFSRSQIRCNALDKKSEVSGHEINTLTEEKIRLQQQVEALESQIDDLSKARDDVQRQSSADGAQWRQIMAMSSQLQMKSAEDARLHKVAEDAWHEEREVLKRRIQELKEKSAVNPVSRRKSNDESPGPGSGDGDVMSSQPLQALRGEVLHLRNRLAGLENLLREVTGETEQIDRAMKAMVKIRALISGQIGDDGESSHG